MVRSGQFVSLWEASDLAYGGVSKIPFSRTPWGLPP